MRRTRDRAVGVTRARGAGGRRWQVLGAGPSRAEHRAPRRAPLSAGRGLSEELPPPAWGVSS